MGADRDREATTQVDALNAADPLGMRIGPGSEVGGFVIDGELGRGGMGVVYSATHPVIGKRAAIKILRLDMSRSQTAIERFIQEARAVNRIGHPNIINIFAYGALPDGRVYQVMDLLTGESLRQRLQRGAASAGEAVSVLDEVASALSATHEHGFIHRDLKPENVYLVDREDRWPEVKLLDFGLAKLMPGYGASAFITKTGATPGTPEYMSPEQARGAGVDHRTDIYALGLVAFELLTGRGPFPATLDSITTTLQLAAHPAPAGVATGRPDELHQLVAAMLAAEPRTRPSLATVRAVLRRLRAQLPGRPEGDAPPAGRGASAPITTPGLGIDAVSDAMRAGRPTMSDRPPGRGLRPRGSDPLPFTRGATRPWLARWAGLRGARDLDPLPATMIDLGEPGSAAAREPAARTRSRWPWFVTLVVLPAVAIALAIALG